MVRSKRKRNPFTRTKPSKRPRYVDSSGSEADDKLWEADCILDEHIVRGVRKYHIKWKGVDPDTGNEWPPTWEPEENANDVLVAEWRREKAQTSEGIQDRGRSEQRAPRRIRNSRVINSSPQSAVRSSSPSAPSTPAGRAGSVHTSSAATTSAGRASPRIHIPRRGDSLERDEYELISQLGSSQPVSTQRSSQDTNLDSPQLFAARPRPHSSGIVPDSQSSTDEGSYIPITQRTETNQQSIGSSRLPEEEDLAEDSVCVHVYYISVTCLLMASRRAFLTSCSKQRHTRIRRRVQYQRRYRIRRLQTHKVNVKEREVWVRLNWSRTRYRRHKCWRKTTTLRTTTSSRTSRKLRNSTWSTNTWCSRLLRLSPGKVHRHLQRSAL